MKLQKWWDLSLPIASPWNAVLKNFGSEVIILILWAVLNPLHSKLYPICHLLALLGSHHILHINRIKVNTQSCKIIYITSFSHLKGSFVLFLFTFLPQWLTKTNSASVIWNRHILCSTVSINSLAYTASCETGWAIDAFAVNSGFVSVDGMTRLIPFESWRNDLSNGISYI
jgi:hypothetical protein